MASPRDPVHIHEYEVDPPQIGVVRPAAREPFPQPLTPLIGREAEIAAIRSYIDGGVRLLTILGPGGVGKTRLAVALAAELAATHPDGVVLVPLAAVPRPSLVLPAMAAALGLRETLGRNIRDLLIATLRQQRLLAVLDNLEHVLEAGPDIASLLAACPSLTILGTSRAPLHLSGEQHFRTSPLAVPPDDIEASPERIAEFSGVRLFVERAREVQSTFEVTPENAALVSEICRRLDGLPLAIELAAPWVRVLPLSAVAAGLENRLSMLHGGPGDQPARLRTMRDAIAWSYDLLDTQEAQLFCRLAIFVDGFTLEAAKVVGEWQPANEIVPNSLSHAMLDRLAALIDASLVQVTLEDGGERRFSLLETVRDYGLEQLKASGQGEQVARIHAETIAAFVATAEPHLLGPDEVRWQAQCVAELGNLRAALAWAIDHDLEMALRMAGSLWVYWSWYQLAEGRRWLKLALSKQGAVAPTVRSRALTTQAALAALEGDAETLRIAQEGLEIAQAAGDRVSEAVALWIRACSVMSGERLPEAIPDLDAALALREHMTSPTDRGWIAYTQAHRGAVAMIMGDRDLGCFHYEAAILEARDVGSPGLLIMFLGDYAGWLIDAHELGEARSLLTEAMALAARHRCLWQPCSPLVSLAIVNAQEGEALVAARQLGAIEEILRRTGLEISYHFVQRYDRLKELLGFSLSQVALDTLRAEGRANPLGVMAEAGEAFLLVSRSLTRRSSGASALTARERDVLRGLVVGASDKEIAAELGIGVRTVGTHVLTIRAKLGAVSRSAAAAIAVREHLV